MSTLNGEVVGYDFDSIDTFEIPFNYRKKAYVLRSANGKAARAFRAAALRNAEMTFNDRDGSRTIRRMQSIADAEIVLLAGCVFEKVSRSDGSAVWENVKDTELERWDSRVIKKLFTDAKKISDLEEGEDTLDALKKKRGEIDEKIKVMEKAIGPAIPGEEPETDPTGLLPAPSSIGSD